MLRWLFPGKEREPARTAYDAIVAQARHPDFYARLGVPDTLDGRFEMILLHLFLLLARLKGQGAAATALARGVNEALIADMDVNLRELGVGDLAVPKRIREMVVGLNGRVAAYERGLADSTGRALEIALENNLYGTVPVVEPAVRAAMATYVREEAAALAAQPLEGLLAGRVAFGPPPGP